ncbi:hypothetical protein NDU88_002406 [Pleurodeles waltl]|uniref:Uncharacterized protein n=1 Tax=Pleurodeles waltl TaxID=8319 RepID=A0AAV7UAQ8_PLEWA|nr:hypothetical protein NDU88_002406 [Pleurodeles waltl]
MPLLGHEVVLMACESAGARMLTRLHILTWGDLYTASGFREQSDFSPDGPLSPSAFGASLEPFRPLSLHSGPVYMRFMHYRSTLSRYFIIRFSRISRSLTGSAWEVVGGAEDHRGSVVILLSADGENYR